MDSVKLKYRIETLEKVICNIITNKVTGISKFSMEVVDDELIMVVHTRKIKKVI